MNIERPKPPSPARATPRPASKKKSLSLPSLRTMIFVMLLVAAALLLVFPGRTALHNRACDSAAKSAGANARLAQQMYFNSSAGGAGGQYASRLEDLLEFDANLTGDPDVTFAFGATNSSGYTFTTRHAQSGTEIEFTGATDEP
jgi:type II secretory pathway pseudopilin PulG